LWKLGLEGLPLRFSPRYDDPEATGPYTKTRARWQRKGPGNTTGKMAKKRIRKENLKANKEDATQLKSLPV